MKLLCLPFIIGAAVCVMVRAFDPTARATSTACAAGGAKTMAGRSPAHEAAHA